MVSSFGDLGTKYLSIKANIETGGKEQFSKSFYFIIFYFSQFFIKGIGLIIFKMTASRDVSELNCIL